MCPRGARDDSDVTMEEPSYRLDDMAELAVRLGSPYDDQRSGEVLHLTDFSAGLGGWAVGTTGAAGYGRLTGAYVKSGGVGVVVASEVSSAAYTHLFMLMPYPGLKSIGFKASIGFDSHVSRVDYRIVISDSVNSIYFDIRYNPALHTLQYLTTSDEWITLSSSLKLAAVLPIFYDFKLLINCETQRYVRFMLNQYEFNMVDFVPSIAVNPITARAAFYIICYGDDVAQGLMYIDNVVITQNDFGAVTL